MKFLALVLALLMFISGCSSPNDSIEQVLTIRSRLQESGCEFLAEIVADYTASVYEFRLSCIADRDGALRFEVVEPDSICGITGLFDNGMGKLTFDDKMLAFAPMCEGILSPVSAPWIFLCALKGGYIVAAETMADGQRIQIEDTYEGNVIHIDVTVDDDWVPIAAEVYWEGCRVICMRIDDFRFV